MHLKKILLLSALAFQGTACESNLMVSPETGKRKNSASVESLDKIVAARGELVIVRGKNLTSDISLRIGGNTYDFYSSSLQEGWFALPQDADEGNCTIEFYKDDELIATHSLWVGSSEDDIPLITLAASSICRDVIYKDSKGKVQNGERACESVADCAADGQSACLTHEAFPAVKKEELAAKILQGEVAGGVSGLASLAVPCEDGGDLPCLADGIDVVAIDPSQLSPDDIRSGVTLAGILGTQAGAPADCQAEGEIACLTNAAFPAVDKTNAVTLNAAKIHSSLSIVGSSGSLSTCSIDGASACVADANFPAIDKINTLSVSNRSKILSGLSIAGVNGTLATCSTDGELGCFVQGAGLVAAATGGASGKILTGQSLAGIAGTAAVRPADCASDAAVTCVATANFPAVDKVAKLSSAQRANIRSGLSLLGLAGTLDDCTSDGEAGCFVGASYVAAVTAGAAAKILSGQSLAGINGTRAGRPADCASDGASDCVAVSAFPAADITGAAAKIMDAEVLAGVTGSVAPKPDDCSADGESACVTLAAYPALDAAGAAGKILLGSTLGGISGSAPVKPLDCAGDGATNCVTVAAFPAVDKLNTLTANAGKIHSSLTLAGVSGSLPDCASDGAENCLTLNSFPAADISGAAAKIIDGQSLAGISGQADVRPADCGTDGQSSCVTGNDFPAVDKVNRLSVANRAHIHSTLSLAGLAGTMNDCGADAVAGCLAVANFPAAKISGAAAKLANNEVLAGVTGTAGVRPGLCSSDGAQGCVADASFPAAEAAGADAVIALGETLAGIAGSAAVRPTDCAVDNASGCVATANFPAVDKVNKLSGVHLAKIKTDLSIAGATGTLEDCAVDGDSGCEVKSGFAAALIAGAAPKILLGQNLAGLSGSAALRPDDCDTDGETGCVAVTNFPAIDKVVKLSAARRSKYHSSLSIAAVAGTMPSCSSDGDASCRTTATYPAMNTSGAAAKILTGQSLGLISGTAAVRPADCATDNGVGCVSVADFPAIDKVTKLSVGNLGKIRSSLSLAGVSGTLSDCSTDGNSNCFIAGAPYASLLTTGAAAKILLGQTVAGISGSAPVKPVDCSADAETGCVTLASFPAAATSGAAAKIQNGQILAGVSGSVAVKPADCAADAGIDCVAVANFPAVDKASKLTSQTAKFHSSLTIAGVTGALSTCASDGASACLTSASFPSAAASGAEAKILQGQSLAGLAGTGEGRPADCSTDNGTNCTAVAAYPAIVKSNVTTNAGSIHSTVTIAGVPGTLATCSSDGASTCMTSSSFPATNTSIAAPKILSGQTLAAVAGSGVGKPADCSADDQVGCVTVTNFPSVQRSTVTEGILKAGTTLVGVTGLYPNSTYKLPSADGTADLTTAAFAGMMASASAFEWYTSAGTRYTKTGDTTIAAANIKNGQAIFGVTGTFAPDCTGDNQTACLTTSRFKSVTTSTLLDWNIRSGKTIGGQAGAIVHWVNRSTLAQYNRTTGAGASTSTTVPDMYDSLNEWTIPTEAPAGYYANVMATWTRDPSSDSNSNGICDGVEHCVYIDKNTGRYWPRMQTTTYMNWEDAISHCAGLTYGGYSDYRMPMDKEIEQARIDGFVWLWDSTKLDQQASLYWTGSTRGGSTWDSYSYSLWEWRSQYAYKPNADAVPICVR